MNDSICPVMGRHFWSNINEDGTRECCWCMKREKADKLEPVAEPLSSLKFLDTGRDEE